ncbi:MAG: uracil-DNA glycosylase, partial [Sphingobium sp.]
GQAASHRGKGWEKFTDAIIAAVNASPTPTVFILWGAHARAKAAMIDDVTKGGRHLILASAHPSPLSAHNGFFGSGPFSKANMFLRERGLDPIDWALPPLAAPPADQ